MRAIAAAVFLLAATPCLADETIGTVQSYEPSSNVLVLTDRTIWYLPPDSVVPEDLKQGERVRISYRSNADNGWDAVTGVTRISG